MIVTTEEKMNQKKEENNVVDNFQTVCANMKMAKDAIMEWCRATFQWTKNKMYNANRTTFLNDLRNIYINEKQNLSSPLFQAKLKTWISYHYVYEVNAFVLVSEGRDTEDPGGALTIPRELAAADLCKFVNDCVQDDKFMNDYDQPYTIDRWLRAAQIIEKQQYDKLTVEFENDLLTLEKLDYYFHFINVDATNFDNELEINSYLLNVQYSKHSLIKYLKKEYAAIDDVNFAVGKVYSLVLKGLAEQKITISGIETVHKTINILPDINISKKQTRRLKKRPLPQHQDDDSDDNVTF
jgi:hypothetical protein